MLGTKLPSPHGRGVGGEGFLQRRPRELLDGGEHHAAGCHRQELPQVLPALRLHGRLAQEVGAARERAEELIVEIVSMVRTTSVGFAISGSRITRPA